jgi:hypothetical protein
LRKADRFEKKGVYCDDGVAELLQGARRAFFPNPADVQLNATFQTGSKRYYTFRVNKTLKQLLKHPSIEELAIPSNVAYGKKIFERKGVKIISQTDGEVEAWVGGLSGDSKSGGGARRHVWFYTQNARFSWHCSGNPKDHDIFCKHCVALALTFLQSKNYG